MKTMKNISTILFLVFFLFTLSYAQDKTKPKPTIASVEQSLKLVAAQIMDNTSFKLVNKKTNETYTSSAKLPVTADIKIQSPYNEWRYWNGVMNIGFTALADVLKNNDYLEYAKKNVSFVFDHSDYFKKQYDANISNALSQKFRMSLLDDCGAMSAGILAVYQHDKQKRYLDYLNTALDYVMNKELRLPDGTFCRKTPFEMSVWGDDLYMSVPFLARMGELTGDRRYFDEAAMQVINFTKILWNPAKQLYHHGYFDDIKEKSIASWGRANGWMIVAQIELLERLPSNHPKRIELLEIFKQQVQGLAHYQDDSGLWHQILDHNETFLETSCSAMFTYAIAKAVNKGWLAHRYAYVAERGWEGITTRILPDGQVEGIGMGTGIGMNNHYYAVRATPLNDIHGLGAVLLAGTEVIKLIEKGIKPLW